jgi:putative endonuclease
MSLTSQARYYAGAAAEDIVAQNYQRRGHALAQKRWRGSAGEIDLIIRDGDGFVFVEVKKSRTHAQAAQRLGRRQMGRIYRAASEYIASAPNGQLTDVRFDVATVDQAGSVNVIENAFMDM